MPWSIISMLYHEVRIRYFHPVYKIGLVSPREAWLLQPDPVRLPVTVYQAQLSYRLPHSRKRISWRQLKQGLLKKHMTIQLPYEPLPF